MTSATEEQLLKDVSYTSGTLARFIKEWDDKKDHLASTNDVSVVCNRIEEHIETHAESKNDFAVWAGIVVSSCIGVFAILRG